MIPRALRLILGVLRPQPVASLGVAVALIILTGGCASNELPQIRDTFELERILATTNQPVLVDFYKGGCLQCIQLEDKLAPVAQEFGGRVVAGKVMLLTPIGISTNQAFAESNDIAYYPTVILYVNGKERHRFVRHYIMDDYRRALSDCLAHPTTRKDAPPGPPGYRD